MDPNTTLDEIREILRSNEQHVLSPDEGDRLCELVRALDEWLSRAGFLPEDWTR